MNNASTSSEFTRGVSFLAAQGLNLYGVLDCAELPDDVLSLMTAQIDVAAYSRLVVVGNTGKQFWRALQSHKMHASEPIDEFSKSVTATYMARFLADAKNTCVFPTQHNIPLQRIGALLGWGIVSPLGIGISDKNGLWWAYRSALLTTAELPVTESPAQNFACAACSTKPCVSACPAAAVSSNKSFNIDACFHFRARENSPCVDTCLARLACPVAPESRYPVAMTQYIYRHSMKTVRRYVEGESLRGSSASEGADSPGV